MKIVVLMAFILGGGYLFFTSNYFFSEKNGSSTSIKNMESVDTKKSRVLKNKRQAVNGEKLGEIVSFKNKNIADISKSTKQLEKKVKFNDESLDSFKEKIQKGASLDEVPPDYPDDLSSRVESYQGEEQFIGEFISVEVATVAEEDNQIKVLSVDSNPKGAVDEVPMVPVEVAEMEPSYIGEFVKVDEDLYEESINEIKEIGEFIVVDSKEGAVDLD